MRTLIRASAITLLAMAAASVPAQAQDVTDLVVVGVYLNIKPQAAADWTMLFKKHYLPALEELKTAGDLLGYHLFVPGIHQPDSPYTHLLVLAYKDRAAQGRAETKLRAVFNKIPAAEGQRFMGATDPSKHFDVEWREIDLSKVTVPEEKEEKKDEKKTAQ